MGDTPVISETTFSAAYSSFWRDLMPNSERFVRRLNLNVERYGLPITASSVPNRRAYINEVAFQLFAKIYPRKPSDMPDIEDIKKQVFSKVRTFIAQLDRAEEAAIQDPSDDEFRESSKIYQSIYGYVNWQAPPKDVIVSPPFVGCGLLDSCNGDLLIKRQLTEIKSGDRAFRATDIRQLLAYCALNSVSHQYDIQSICLLNPRRGTYFQASLDSLSIETAGKAASELLSDIAYFLSSGDLSR